MTATPDNTEIAALHLMALHRAGIPGARLPDAARPDDIDSALAIQRRVVALSGDGVGGWKCALPPPGRVVVAPILASRIHDASDAPFPVAGDAPIVRIEPELAFVLDHNLPRRDRPYDEAEVRGAIRDVRLVLEVLGCRYAEPERASAFELLADNQFNQGLCVGPVVPDGLHVPLDAIALDFHGALDRTIDGRHPDGDPLKPLLWLVNFLAARGEPVRAGQIVTTGSYAGALDVPRGQPLRVNFGALGALSMQGFA
jgi:2-keto-4-pentenoate hydratase